MNILATCCITNGLVMYMSTKQPHCNEIQQLTTTGELPLSANIIYSSSC